MISTLVMQEEKRGDLSKRPALRLPIIAPKDDYSSSASSSRSGKPSVGPSIPPRARLPPRSRTGCWTCRSRKVKCDEGRPICGQCGRLGHNCDYSPRLSFRDDTPRVVERMQEVSIVGSSVWDSTSPAPTEASTGSAILDDLPPFAQLGTDEDRERKAERSSPGTYHVVVNPDSFQHLPEYSDDSDAKRERLSPLRRGSLSTSLASSWGRESTSEIISLANDPNTVILPRFEDVARRVSSKDPKSPRSPVTAKIKLEDGEDSHLLVDGETESTQERYLRQFHQVVWKQLVPTEIGQILRLDGSSSLVVEQQASCFEPLYHAIMAVAALSMATFGGDERLDALQHYEQALPALHNLKSAEDVSSDGVFLTHFLLLIYEIAAAEDVQSNLWAQHLTTLLNITRLRREVFGGEKYPYVVWWICNIDLDAMFTGAGAGQYVGEMLQMDIVPPPDFHLYPLGEDGSSVVYEDEVPSLPIILHLDYEVTVLAVRLALLSQEFRNNLIFTDEAEQERDIKIRHSRVYDLQEALRQCWAAPAVAMVGQNVDRLPYRSKKLFEHACTLYRACIIYSHTSMWSTQRLDTSPDYDTEISVASNQILHMANRLLDEGGSDCRFLVFPIFMAGFASTDGTQKTTALELIRRMERQSIGRNTTATRKALSLIYEKQAKRFMMTGQSLDVDWMDVIKEQNMLIVNFGL